MWWTKNPSKMWNLGSYRVCMVINHHIKNLKKYTPNGYPWNCLSWPPFLHPNLSRVALSLEASFSRRDKFIENYCLLTEYYNYILPLLTWMMVSLIKFIVKSIIHMRRKNYANNSSVPTYSTRRIRCWRNCPLINVDAYCPPYPEGFDFTVIKLERKDTDNWYYWQWHVVCYWFNRPTCGANTAIIWLLAAASLLFNFFPYDVINFAENPIPFGILHFYHVN